MLSSNLTSQQITPLANDDVREPEPEPEPELTLHDKADLGTTIELEPIVGVKYPSLIFFFLDCNFADF